MRDQVFGKVYRVVKLVGGVAAASYGIVDLGGGLGYGSDGASEDGPV